MVLSAREGFDVYGIEESSSGVNHCWEWLNFENLQVSIGQGDMATIPYPDGFFGFVLSSPIFFRNPPPDLSDLSKIRRFFC